MKLSKSFRKKFGSKYTSSRKGGLDVEMMDAAKSANDVARDVLLSEDLMGRVFQQMSLMNDSSYSASEIARYGLVCRVWAQAVEYLPIALEFSRPLQQQQREALLNCRQSIGFLSLDERDSAAMQVLLDPIFKQKQGMSLRYLRNIDCVDSYGFPIDLLGYPNLQQLFLSCESRLKQDPRSLHLQPCVAFRSSMLSHLHKLKTLSLRGYHALDLRCLPLSLQELYVGGARLVGGDEDTDDNLATEAAALAGTGESARPNTDSNPFPQGVSLRLVVINSQRGGWFSETLSLYFSAARQVIYYGRTLLIRNPHRTSCQTLAECLVNSPARQLDLEFEQIFAVRSRFAPRARELWAESQWHRQEVSALELMKQMVFRLPGYVVKLSRGALFEHKITVIKLDSK